MDDNGKIQLGQAQPEWKEYMEYLHRWWEMDLIDKDFITMDDAAVRTKGLNNEIGASYTILSRLTFFINDAKEAGNGAEWGGVSYPRTAPGAPTCMIQSANTNASGYGAVITTSCPEEKLITALRWLNYGYTEEGFMYWNYGTEGVSYTLDENGEPQWTDVILNDPEGVGVARSRYIGTAGQGISIQAAHMVEIGNAPEAGQAVYTWIENSEANKHKPVIHMTEEEKTRYADLVGAIQPYCGQQGLKFMTGDASLDEFDAYLEELERLGLSELLEIQQTAYDRTMSQ